MKKENKERTSEWITELGELITVKYCNKTHKAFLSKDNLNNVRKPYGDKK